MARLKTEPIPAEDLTENAIRHIVSIGRRQAELLDEMEAALADNDAERVIALAREICGLEKQVSESTV